MTKTKQTQWEGKSRGGSLGHLCFVMTIKYLGIKAAYTLLCVVVPYFIIFSPKSTSAIWHYNSHILKQGAIRAFLGIIIHYYRFGQTIIDKVAIANGMIDRYKYSFENYDEFLNILNSGCGTIMIGAHVGNWAIGAPFFDEYGKKLNIVMQDAEYQKIKKIVERNVMINYKIIALTEESLESVLKIKNAIDAGEYVCFQGDRFIKEKHTLLHLFMDYDARFPAGPFLFATRMKTPVVFYFAMREKGLQYRFHFVIARPVERKGYISMEQQLLGQYVEALEQIVRNYPDQWFNFYKYWNP